MSHDSPRFHLPMLTPAIRWLLLANAAVFLGNAALLGRLSDPAGAGGFWFAFSWGGMFDGYGLGLLRAVTYQFTHSFREPMHLLLNMLVLYFFGTMAEQRLGPAGTVRLYLWGGLAGAAAHLVVAAVQGQADVPLVGASGACYAFLLYATFMAPRATVLLLVVPVPLWVLAAALVGIGVYATFVEFATGAVGPTSHGAHLGGAACGALAFRLGWCEAPRETGFFAALCARWRARRQLQQDEAAAARQSQLDEVLAKVKDRGLASLSAGERRFLARMSERARGGR